MKNFTYLLSHRLGAISTANGTSLLDLERRPRRSTILFDPELLTATPQVAEALPTTASEILIDIYSVVYPVSGIAIHELDVENTLLSGDWKSLLVTVIDNTDAFCWSELLIPGAVNAIMYMDSDGIVNTITFYKVTPFDIWIVSALSKHSTIDLTHKDRVIALRI